MRQAKENGLWQKVQHPGGEKIEVAIWLDPRKPRDQRVTCMKVRWNGEVRLMKRINFHYEKPEDGELCHYLEAEDKSHHYTVCIKMQTLDCLLKSVEPLE